MTPEQELSIRRAIMSIEAGIEDCKGSYYVQAWMNLETATAELRALIGEAKEKAAPVVFDAGE